MFCENCGRPLLDGEICNCTQQTPSENDSFSMKPAPAEPETGVSAEPTIMVPDEPETGVSAEPTIIIPDEPEASVSDAPASPLNELPEAPASPLNELPEAPAAPLSELPEAPTAPLNELPEAPAAPLNELPEAPASPLNELPEAPTYNGQVYVNTSTPQSGYAGAAQYNQPAAFNQPASYNQQVSPAQQNFVNPQGSGQFAQNPAYNQQGYAGSQPTQQNYAGSGQYNRLSAYNQQFSASQQGFAGAPSQQGFAGVQPSQRYDQPGAYPAQQNYTGSPAAQQRYAGPQQYNQPQAYNQPQQYNQPQAYNQPQQYNQPQAYNQPQQYNQPQAYNRSYPGQQPYAQPAYTQSSPAYRFAGFGTSAYKRIAAFLSSPLILVYAIAVGGILVIDLISFFRIIEYYTTSSLIATIVGFVLQILLFIAPILVFASARGYISKGKPISSAGFSIASGVYLTYGILHIILDVLLFVSILIMFFLTSVPQMLLLLFIPIISIFLWPVEYFTLNSSFRAIRFMVTGRGRPGTVSAYPMVIMVIKSLFTIVRLILAFVIFGFADTLIYKMYDLIPRDVERMLWDIGLDIGDLFARVTSLFSTNIMIVISAILSFISLILGVVIFAKARKAQQDAAMMKN